MRVDFDHEVDVIVLGLGAAGGCAAIEAHDHGAEVLVIEKQPAGSHYSNTRMSGGGFHSPSPDGDPAALKAYAKAMFSGDGLPLKLEAEMPEYADELAEIWAREAPENEGFMRSLDPMFQTISMANAAFPDFPGAADAGYSVVRSSYTGSEDENVIYSSTIDLDKSQKNAGEAFHACMMTGVGRRGIAVHYDTRGRRFLMGEDGEITGVSCLRDGEIVNYGARRAVIVCTGGYEYNKRMRKAFLDGPAVEGWAFYGSPANTGDGIEMATRIGAGLAKVGSVAGRVICAIPERRHGLKIGLNTNGVGKPNEIVVDSYGSRFASERRITKDPSRYIFYKEALRFDTLTLDYPRIPAWMIFDETLRRKGAVIWTASAVYNGVDWGDDNLKAIENGWILKAQSIEELAGKIRQHSDNMERMDAATLVQSVERYNAGCAEGVDREFNREPQTLGPVETPPFYALPLYPGGPNTKGGLLVNATRQVLDWDGEPIPRLYAAGEIASVFQFVYQGGGNLAESITFGRLAGRLAAAEPVRSSPMPSAPAEIA
ncbi:3-oxosteroid 1-dehydrogenase [Agaricicola taiwanensis]|uniref:3-oxosteroid 1-dehydrogenase n=1 Tax=Agaricicola taiwanensis TaxID=591372 RepID=A0A8J3DZF0_9RHOB|nr:FAD-dependent oxidoreductase [Agaricicola taiwanensis]GGE54888.1 3-oxosteroid 1-dehydrogenase [Agaricicola taiwanensis]